MAFTLTLYKNSWAVNKINKTNLVLYKTVTGNVPPADIRSEIPLGSPSFIIQNDGEPDCNYAYVAEFSRYYFVSTPIHVGGNLWRLNLDEDLLMTHSSMINTLTPFISRYEDSDTYEETLDPMESPRTVPHEIVRYGMQTDTSGVVWTTTATRCYVVTFSKTPTEITCMNQTYQPPIQPYVVCTLTGLGHLANTTNILQLPNSMDENISQVIMLPFEVPIRGGDNNYVTKINFGPLGEYNISGGGVYVGSWSYLNDVIIRFKRDILTGLDTSPRFNLAQYRRFYVDFQPWGRIVLDNNLFSKAKSMRLELSLKGVSGVASLSVIYYSENYSGIIGTQLIGTTFIGIQTPFAGGSTVNTTSLIGLAGGVAGGIASAVSGNVVGGIAAVGSVAASLGQLETPGGVIAGSPNFWDITPYIQIVVFDHVNIAPHLMGRIYNKTLTISQIADNSYFQCGSVIVPSVGLSYDDAKKIETLLKAGVYK